MTENKDLEERIKKLEQDNAILRKFVGKTLNVQHKLTHSLKDSIVNLIGGIPGVGRAVRLEMQKQIDIVSSYIREVKALMGFK